MSDFNQKAQYDVLSGDLMGIIAEYLGPKELSDLKSVSHFLNNKLLSRATVLQPLYNHLYLLDKSLPALLDANNPFLAFKHAFEQIQTRQQEEIDFLKTHDPALQFPEILGRPIEILEQTGALLNQINSDIIEQAIKAQPGTKLTIKNKITRFIIPSNCHNYFANLEYLDCSENILTNLNLEACPYLKSLDCNQNRLISLNFHKNKQIQGLYCQNNLLPTLTVNDHPTLKFLNCNDNQLLILTVQRCTKLTGLHCQNNPLLITLNLDGNTVLQGLHCNSNPSLTTLSLQECTSISTIKIEQSKQIINYHLQGISSGGKSILDWHKKTLLVQKSTLATKVVREPYKTTYCTQYNLETRQENPVYFIPSFTRTENNSKRKREENDNRPDPKKSKPN